MGSFTAFKAPVATEITVARNCQYGQCIKIKKDGYRCKNCAQQGSSYCWSHRPR